MMEYLTQVQKYCWSINDLNKPFKEKPRPFTKPRLKQTISFLGTAIRCRKHLKQCKRKKIDSHIDFFSPLYCYQMYGAPIGAIGTGSIGRSFTGDFARFQLIPGLYEHKVAEANMFTVCIRKNESTCYQQALVCRRSKLKGLKSWNMAYPASNATYHALYPQAWYVYDLPGQNVKLTCHQLSPIMPHNYKDTSLPCALFDWTIENNNQRDDIELSLMFTWQSGSSSDKFELTNVSAMPFEDYNSSASSSSNDLNITGVLLKQQLRKIPLDYCISAKSSKNVSVTYNCQFYPKDEQTSSELWNDLYEDGELNNKKYFPIDLNKEETNNNRSNNSSSSANNSKPLRMAIAVCAKVKVKANSKEKISFSLVWHMPFISFPGDTKTKIKKFYNRYFSHENPNTPLDMAHYSLVKQNNWMEDIKNWQSPILQDETIPEFFKRSLFNELYFIADGGSIWVDAGDDCPNQLVREHGRFAYLEGHEYRMYNTYDVHFYASFALLQLWPKLQLSLQYDFAETIQKEKTERTKFLFNGKHGIQKYKNCVPHDIGEPEDMPWENLNAYILHDTRDWKDLNLKFILTVYRDYYHTKDDEYLKYMWPLIKVLLKTIESQPSDEYGLIKSNGEPDQTYDAWSVTGASAYCGGLHIAALQCVCKMAEVLDEADTRSHYEKRLDMAKTSYDLNLWNGKYYKYDSKNESIMADMCCGHWFLRCCGFEYEAFEREKIKSCLETIFEYNVMKYANGKRGAVNGMRKSGRVDITSIQSEEVWIGVTDALSSLMMFEGLNDKAWKTIEGLYDLCYNQLGLAFQMPEALMKSNVYRSLGYMRPLCIWSIQYALDRTDRTAAPSSSMPMSSLNANSVSSNYMSTFDTSASLTNESIETANETHSADSIILLDNNNNNNKNPKKKNSNSSNNNNNSSSKNNGVIFTIADNSDENSAGSSTLSSDSSKTSSYMSASDNSSSHFSKSYSIRSTSTDSAYSTLT